MKITPEQVAVMRSAIEPLDTPQVRDAYRNGNFPRADRVQDLDMRYRWDLLNAARLTKFVIYLYDEHDCNDNHIDTALRSIVAPL